MKLSVLLLLIAIHISAKGVSQQISISVDNAPLSQVLRSVARQSDISLMYSEPLLKNTHSVTLRMQNVSVRQALDACLKGQPLVYIIQGDHILIQPKVSQNTALDRDTTITIQGKITSAGQTPLVGVTVMVKGTTIGTISNVKGHYMINADAGDSLVFRYLGYQEKHVAVGDRQTINVQLLSAANQLNQLVVVGYGTQRKEDVTGAVEQVSSKVFDSRAVTNPALALQGETPGLVITRSSARPGNEGINFQIRGVTSVNGGSPLIVIDGIPVVSDDEFLNMNPDDIASVTVLKDGMAAIYGARAANGVILVTTKKGQKGKIRVDYNANVRINTIGITTPIPTMQQYATMWLDAEAQESVPNYWGWSLPVLDSLQKGIPGIYPTTYWGNVFLGPGDRFKELFGPEISQQHNLSISGGTENTSYRLSAAYANNRANLRTAYDGQKQYNIRLDYDFKITKGIKLETGVAYQSAITSSPSSGIDAALVAEDPPLYPAKNPYGEWYANFGTAGNRNSVAATMDGGRSVKTNNLVTLNGKLTVKLWQDLDFEGTASIQSLQYRMDQYNLTVPQYEWDGTLAPSELNPTSSVRAESDNTLYQDYNALLHYDAFFGDHHITASTGITSELNEYKGLYGYRTDIPSNGVYDLNLAGLDHVEATGGQNHWGLYSYIARVSYSYKDKYLVQLLGRRDGSSRFAPGHRWSNFGNASVGWIVSKENFMKGLEPIISFLKLRASYGVMGNQEGIGEYDYLSTISQGSAVLGNPAALQTASWVSAMTSDTRTWERVNMRNAGIDFGFLSDRLSGSFDYYLKENNGMLISITYPSVLGATAPKTNAGVLKVHGWEAQVTWKDRIGKFSYNVGLNMGDSRDKLISMEGASTINPGLNSTVVGYPVNSWFLYETDGYFANQKEVDDYYAKYTVNGQGTLPPQQDQTQNLRPGDTRKVDLNQDGIIDQRDVKFMGDAAPHYIYGINLGGAFRNFDLNVFFQGVLDENIVRNGWNSYPFYAVWTNPNIAFMGKTWTEQNPKAEFPRLTVNNVRSGWDYANNDFMKQNDRYIRLKSLIVGYTVPASITQRVHVDRVRVYLSGSDLWELTAIKDGYDPEQGDASQNDGYPFFRTWSLGLNVSF